MSSPVPVPRYHLGEVAYQLLWAGIVLLPLVAGGLRALIAIGLAYLTLLVAIRVEGERALARWGEAGDVSVGGEQLGQ